MIEIKTKKETSEYNYNVCEVASCVLDGTKIYSDLEETKIVNVCQEHYKLLQQIKFW
jgi:hypothetical protein